MKREGVKSAVVTISVFRRIFGMAVLLAALAVCVPLAGANTILGVGGALYVEQGPVFSRIPATLADDSASVSPSPCLESDSGSLDIEGVKGRAGGKVRVPVRIQHAPNQVTSFGFEVTYPAQVMEYTGFEPGDLAASSPSLEVTSLAPDRLSVAGAASENAIPQGASGYLVWLNFTAKEDIQENEQQNTGQEIGIANPASVYCIKNGGNLEIRQDEEGNQYGVCLFSDGSECEEWAYFRGECSPVQTCPCYSLQLESLQGDLARFSASHGRLSISSCQGGDLNADGKVTPVDALIAFRCYIKSGPCSECTSECADVNEDGRVTPSDALCIFESYLGKPSCLDHQPQAAPAPTRMEGSWQSQTQTDGGSLVVDQEKHIVEMADSSHNLGQGSLTNFLYTPTGGSSPISFQAIFAGGSYTASFTGTASNSLCPPGVWCIWEGRFSVDGTYSLKDSLGQLLDEGTFNLKYPVYP